MKILATGLSARFTDLGRVGHQHKGFAQSGALDRNSHLLANSIVKVAENNPTIEVLLGGFKAVATQDLEIAVTGAQSIIKIGDICQPLNKQLLWKKGETLQIMEPSLGARNYIACRHRFKTAMFLNSCCAVMREKTGGLKLDGKGLQIGDELSYENKALMTANASTSGVPDIAKLAHEKQINQSASRSALKEVSLPTTSLAKHYTVRLVLGYQHALFDHKMKARFFNQCFSVSNEASNMGIRLTGESIEQVSVKLYSEGIANGAVQITPTGLPIIMLAERQTIGGYPKIGSVIANDLPELGQCRPGSTIQFEECDLLTARKEWLLRQVKMNRFCQNEPQTSVDE
ncbi:biotin-dependent carboxyltransferase family protein [Brumicola nitratireducens]|uniref:Putative carboxylase n=1 Tax=Glaciecola nitratireducens (strain JCM 12485 / KCTC 12276 / FR1064) TaxID=1085623 RepID=G4QKI8_GLANF|nr:biotin-dependent carboxyltransferase family protein [Glaciecola nitratireducens]AEP30054.1 putative carboxylase [Glaciecola nitratireducens FR1064]